MYIAPNTTIKILKNVPLDPTYDHTIYFSPDSSGNTAQYNYFITKAKYTLTENTYQRVNKGKIRVGIEADNLYDEFRTYFAPNVLKGLSGRDILDKIFYSEF